MKLNSGHDAAPLEGEEKAKYKRDFGDLGETLARFTPGRILLPARYQDVANKIYNFKFRSSDVVVLTYPKCGTTWTQEIAWTMQNNPNLNHPWADRSVHARAPFLEFDMVMPVPDVNSASPKNPIFEAFLELCPDKNPHDGISLQLAEAIPDPRTFKTHLPFSLLPPSMLDTAKVVFVARNPKDAIISYHHHFKMAYAIDYVGTFEDFVQYFIDGDLLHGPYSLFLKEAWERKNHPNLHIMFYEDMKADPLQELRNLNTFLNTNLTESQLENIVRYTSFGEMKARDAKQKEETSKKVEVEAQVSEKIRMKQEYLRKEGGFFRKGEVGDWKNKFTPESDAKVNRWVEENFSKLGISFRYGN